MFTYSCKKEAPPAPPETVKMVNLETVSAAPRRGKEYPARAEAGQAADMSFRVAGPVIEMPIKQGVRVNAGDLLARIDPRDFETRVKDITGQLEESRAQLSAMKTGARPEDILRLEANVRARKAEFDEASSKLERYDTLLKEEVISKQEWEEVKSAQNVTVENLENATQQLEIGRKGSRPEDIQAQEARITGLEAQLAAAEAALKDTELRAPFAGVIARTNIETFEDVQAKQVILSLQDLSKIILKVHISESDLGRSLAARTIEEVTTNLKATATFGSLGGRYFPLKVREFQSEADPTTQTFEVVLEMEQPEDKSVVPGMNATVAGDGSGVSAAVGAGVLVPIGAVFADNTGRQHVWVVDASGRVAKRPVTAGDISGDRLWITEGLAAGDVIATSAVGALAEGMKVAQMTNPRNL